MSSGLRHPASLYKKTGLLRLLIGLMGAPVAWLVQMSVSNIVASYNCFPRRTPLSEPLWQGMNAGLTVFSLLCLAAGIFSAAVALTTWRQAQQEDPGGKAPAAAANVGSMRFVLLLGLMSSGLFTASILLTTCAILLVAPCRPWL